MPGKVKTSCVWKHFRLENSNTAVCNHRKVKFSYCKSTTSLLKHLKMKHLHVNLNEPSECVRDDDLFVNPTAKQQKWTSFFRTPVTPSKSKRVTELILNLIIGGVRPISLVEDEDFKIFVNEVVPGYNLPTCRTFTRKLEEKLTTCKASIRNLLRDVKYASTTTDLWSSITMDSFLGVTMHFVDAEFKLVNLVLATKEVSGAHTGENIAAWLEAILEDYEVSPCKVVAVVTDNGANMVKACNMLREKHGWQHVRCAAHTLQLCVKPALEIQEIKSAIGNITFYSACKSRFN